MLGFSRFPIIWCDEKLFRCGCRGSRTFIGRESDIDKYSTPGMDRWVGGGKGIMVWMGVSLRYGGFIHIFEEDSSLKGNNFKNAMTKRGGFLSFLRRHSAAVVVMDNATIHNTTRTYFKERGVKMLDCPPKSPDMTPIENLWSVMDAIKCRKKPLNREFLKESITASYNELLNEVGFVERTLKSVPNRMRIVIEKEGGHCGY